MKVSYDSKTEELMIDGKRYDGFIAEEDGCKTCNASIIYSHQFDALFCPGCNAWLESSCDDPDCDFCATRSAKPL